MEKKRKKEEKNEDPAVGLMADEHEWRQREKKE